MIIRSAVQCDTCDTIFTVRIGMGQGLRQEHTIQCLGCKEPMSFGMTVDYQNISTNIFAIDGCKIVQAPAYGIGRVINVDANFVVPEGMVNEDISFHRLTQMRDMIKAAETYGPLQSVVIDANAPRKPSADHVSEWQNLKKAISLSSNGKAKLANRKINSANEEHYSGEPLTGPTDWFFRFTLKYLGRKHGDLLKALMAEFKSISRNHSCDELLDHYANTMVKERFARYREIYTDFFSKHSQFSQVALHAGLGLVPTDDMVATSVQFDLVKSFYGDAYEVFAGSVDLLAMLNNVKLGRRFNEFEKLTLQQYRQLDNSSKFNPFEKNAAFASLCVERDNQLRNASHHKGITMDANGRTLRYRAGKGGTGDEQEMTYANYLYSSATIFLQISVLVALELTICSRAKIDLPFD